MKKVDEQCDISIRNCSGVPVLDIAGNLNKMSMATIETTLKTLISAGHYNIVLNLRKVAAANLEMLDKLTGAAQAAVKHYGAIDVVAEASAVRKLVSLNGLGRMFRFCTSETEAFRRIKKLTRSPEQTEPNCVARIVEAK